jgi:NADH dehydrogenase
MPELHVVTGAFGYSGKYIATRLLEKELHVRTLTNSPQRAHPFGERVEVRPFHFENPKELVASLEGAAVLYNTYWVRFNHASFSFSKAVHNTLSLFEAARQAGLKRIVHISITNPSEDSPLEYFNCKARLERALIDSGLSYAILRPTVLFGKEDILINNIAWALRRLPAFGVFGDGEYRLQPIYVDDLARLMVEEGQETENRIINAIGPETFTFRSLVEDIGAIIGRQRTVLSIPPGIGYAAGWLIGKIMGDVLITHDEIAGLMAGLLYCDTPPTGTKRLTDWAQENSATLGISYASELARRQNRLKAYETL